MPSGAQRRAIYGITLLLFAGCAELADVDFEALITVEDISPSRVSASRGGELTVTGRNFQPGARLWLGEVEVTARSQSPTSITFYAPPGPVGPKVLRIKNTGGAETAAEGMISYAAEELRFGAFDRPVLETARYTDLHTGDVNSDGLDDIVRTNEDGAIEVLLNEEEGQRFECAQLIEDAPWMVGLADLDGDGHLDLVEARGVRYGDGLSFGALSSGMLDNSQMSIQRFAVGDLDGDGVLDLAFFEAPSALGPLALGRLVVARQSTGLRGQYTRKALQIEGQDGPLLTRDLDGDGRADLLFLSDTRLPQVVYAPLDDPITLRSTPIRSSTPVAMALVDVDADGIDDLVFQGRLEDRRATLVARGTGAGPAQAAPFEPAIEQLPMCGAPLIARELIPWKRGPDGLLKHESPYLMADCTTYFTIVGQTDAGRPLQALAQLSLERPVRAVRSADLDGRDGPDVLLQTDAGLYPLYAGKRDIYEAVLSEHRSRCITSACSARRPASLGVAVGAPFAVGRFSDRNRVAAVEDDRLVVFGDLEELGGRAPSLSSIPGSEGRFPINLIAGDLDGDGDDDLAVTFFDGNMANTRITPLLNQGETWSAIAALSPTSILPEEEWREQDTRPSLHLWDLDQDGAAEIIWGNSQHNIIWSWDGEQVQGRLFELQGPLHAVKAFDVDADGDLDLMSLGSLSGLDFQVQLNQGDHFERRALGLQLPAPGFDLLIEPGPGGTIDLWIISMNEHGPVLWLEQHRMDPSRWTAERLQRYTSRRRRALLHRAELDGDGLLDLVIAPVDSEDDSPLFGGELSALLASGGPLIDVKGIRAFGHAVYFPVVLQARFLDVDRDGLDDLLLRSDIQRGELVFVRNESR